MKRKSPVALLLVLLLTFCQMGCYPYKYVSKPGAMGKAIDARTRRPVPGATVVLVTDMETDNHQASTKTAGDGTFFLDEERGWGLAMLPIACMLPRGYHVDVTVAAKGYEETKREFRVTKGGTGVKKLGEIGLSPLPR